MGSKLFFFLTTNGLVEPAPWVPSDANANVLYDWTEFARASSGGNGIFINTTTVDMFSIPLTVSVTSSAGVKQTQGIPGNRTGIFSAVTALGSPWSSLITTRAVGRAAAAGARAGARDRERQRSARPTSTPTSRPSGPTTPRTRSPCRPWLGNFTGTTSGNNWAFRDAGGARHRHADEADDE